MELISSFEGQGDSTLRQRMSSDSLELPWQNLANRRPLIVSESQTGRQVTPDSFFLCFIAFLQLAAGTGLLGVCIWSLVKKIAYVYLIETVIDITYFSIPGALICYLCFWIAASIINSRNGPFLLLLLVFILASCILLATGTFIGYTYKSKLRFNGEHRELVTKITKSEFVASMGESITQYDSDDKHRANWDATQKILGCCGIINATDWILTRNKIPDSCCRIGNCTEESSFQQNCVNAVSYDIFWFKVFISNLNIIVISCHVLCVILMIYIYVWWRKH